MTIDLSYHYFFWRSLKYENYCKW